MRNGVYRSIVIYQPVSESSLGMYIPAKFGRPVYAIVTSIDNCPNTQVENTNQENCLIQSIIVSLIAP